MANIIDMNYKKGEAFGRLEEMNEAMESSIDNAEKVLKQQHKLIEALTVSDDCEAFKELIQSLKEQNENLSEQISTLKTRLEHFDKYKDYIENDPALDIALYHLVEFLGLFNNK